MEGYQHLNCYSEYTARLKIIYINVAEVSDSQIFVMESLVSIFELFCDSKTFP